MKSLKDRIQSKASIPFGSGQGKYQIVGGHLISTADSKSSYIDNGYSINDNLYSVINLILDKVRIVPWNLFKVVDESSLKAYRGMQMKQRWLGDDFRKAEALKNKALEPIQNASMSTGKLQDLLKWANEYESFSDFVTNGIGYKLITGDKYLWANILDGGANTGKPQELWVLPSQAMIIYASESFPAKELGYKMMFWNIDYQKSEVLHEKYWNPNWGINGQQLYGMSPVKALLKTLTRNNSALDASSSQFQNQGLKGVLYMDDDRVFGTDAVAQAQALKAKMVNEFTGPMNQGKIAVSGYKTGFTSLGLSPVELGIIEAEKWDLRKFCNIYGVPSQLMNDPQNRTYNNQKEGEKAFTSRAVIPHMVAFRECFNQKLQTDWGFKGINVYADFDQRVFTELQQDMAEIGQWTASMIAMTPNEQRDLFGMPARPEPEMDELWVLNQSRTPLSDYQANLVDSALNGGGGNSDQNDNNPAEENITG